VQWAYPFYCDRGDPSCEVVQFKDLYKLQYELFLSKFWVMFYLLGATAVLSHMSYGLSKIISSHALVPLALKQQSTKLGYVFTCALGLLYMTYPVYCHLYPVTNWTAYDADQDHL
jgi:hypothetical protein